MSKMVEEIKIFSKAIDPIYIGTGGYTIGRVDNTIVRDPLNRVPKIPGSSLAGTWRFYSALYIQGKWKDIEDNWGKFEQKEHFITSYMKHLKNKKDENNEGFNIDNEEELKDRLKKVDFRKFILKLRNIFWENGEKKWDDFWKDFWSYFENYKEKLQDEEKQFLDKIYENMQIIKSSIYSTIYCAGQDELPQEEIKDEDRKENTIKGHCGRCIVCKSFGYSKNSNSWQGILFFSDLEIILFPVYTREGTKFITTEEKLKYLADNTDKNNKIKYAYNCDESGDSYINLGWLNVKVKKLDVNRVYELKNYKLEYKNEKDNNWESNNNHNIREDSDNKNGEDKLTINAKDIIVVPDKIFSQVVNANLEVRTSVSIDPITGTAKDGGLFTSEAIPRGTIFYGSIRIFDKSIFDKGILSNIQEIKNMLLSSKCYFETLGIGGLTTRGFGRMKVILNGEENNGKEGEQNNGRK